MTTTHEPRRMTRDQHLILLAVTLWIAAILMLTTAAWSGNGYAGITGLLMFIGGIVAAAKADRT